VTTLGPGAPPSIDQNFPEPTARIDCANLHRPRASPHWHRAWTMPTLTPLFATSFIFVFRRAPKDAAVRLDNWKRGCDCSASSNDGRRFFPRWRYWRARHRQSHRLTPATLFEKRSHRLARSSRTAGSCRDHHNRFCNPLRSRRLRFAA